MKWKGQLQILRWFFFLLFTTSRLNWIRCGRRTKEDGNARTKIVQYPGLTYKNRKEEKSFELWIWAKTLTLKKWEKISFCLHTFLRDQFGNVIVVLFWGKIWLSFRSCKSYFLSKCLQCAALLTSSQYAAILNQQETKKHKNTKFRVREAWKNAVYHSWLQYVHCVVTAILFSLHFYFWSYRSKLYRWPAAFKVLQLYYIRMLGPRLSCKVDMLDYILNTLLLHCSPLKFKKRAFNACPEALKVFKVAHVLALCSKLKRLSDLIILKSSSNYPVNLSTGLTINLSYPPNWYYAYSMWIRLSGCVVRLFLSQAGKKTF